jgi:hypothetical protein
MNVARILVTTALTIGLAACGGNDLDGAIGGSLSGLGTGLSLTLQDNSADSLTLTSNGSFQFATKLPAGHSYNVTVLTQPEGQACDVANGSGTLDSFATPVSTVAVVCVSTSSVTGTVSGLALGTGVTLSNGAVLLPIAANGPFAFPGQVSVGSTYEVTVATQPVGQTCAVTNGTGTVAANTASQVTVTCS